MPGWNLKTAVPALGPDWITCAVPSRWISVQYVAEASQKLTRPVVTVVEPEITAAVSVTSLPADTDPPAATVWLPEVMVKVVVDDAEPAQACGTPTQRKAVREENRIRRQEV